MKSLGAVWRTISSSSMVILETAAGSTSQGGRSSLFAACHELLTAVQDGGVSTAAGGSVIPAAFGIPVYAGSIFGSVPSGRVSLLHRFVLPHATLASSIDNNIVIVSQEKGNCAIRSIK
ncbi:unnamed protein product [Cuscuta europaea]|uniref:Uncharacterized protein n=1 Tax=Cuscuta europaea TaxID=41803 RepID=A0A9P1E4R3_CUSEU|nr:unnamed protein product [Cuscuta europaea]